LHSPRLRNIPLISPIPIRTSIEKPVSLDKMHSPPLPELTEPNYFYQCLSPLPPSPVSANQNLFLDSEMEPTYEYPIGPEAPRKHRMERLNAYKQFFFESFNPLSRIVTVSSPELGPFYFHLPKHLKLPAYVQNSFICRPLESKIAKWHISSCTFPVTKSYTESKCYLNC